MIKFPQMNAQLLNHIVEYIQSFTCPEHQNEHIKFINFSQNVPFQKRLICSDCASSSIDGYLEVKAAVIKMNKEILSPPAKLMFNSLFNSISKIQNKINSYANPKIYFQEITQNQSTLFEFQQEAHSYYLNNTQNFTDQQILTSGKNDIKNTIQIFERFQHQISDFLIHPMPQQPYIQDVCKLEFKEAILIETDFNDSEFYIAKHGQLLIYSSDQNNLELLQTITLKEIDINCIIKAHYKQFIFLGRKDGYVEIFEQLSNRNYVSSHLLQAHSFNPINKHFGVSCIIINQEDSEFITGGYDSLIMIWRFQNYQWINKQVLRQHKSVINSLSYNFDFTLFGSASQDQNLALYKLTLDNKYANACLMQKEQKVNTICFINSTDFFISLNQERVINLYRIKNLKQPNFNIDFLYKIDFNMLNTDILIKVQPIYYQPLNILIYQNTNETYFLSKNQQTEKFELIPFNIQNQNFTFHKGDAVRFYQLGQFAIHTYKRGINTFVQVFRI